MACEPNLVFDKGAPLNVTRLAGFKITIIGTVGNGDDSDLVGIARGDSETWRRMGDATIVEAKCHDAFVRLALSGGALVGAVVMGDQSLSFPLQEIISAGADVGGIAGALVAPGAQVDEIIESFYAQWRRDRG
jgi:hypothetical protein